MISQAEDWPYARVFAHRCGGTLAPENTLSGLAVAHRHRCGVEFDAMLSADSTPFLIHDETLERTTDGRGAMAETRDEALQRLDAGGWFGASFAGEPLPTLVETGRRCIELGLDVNIEIKPSAGADESTALVVSRLASELWWGYPLPPLLSSFSERALEVAARTAPGLPRGLLLTTIPPDWEARCSRLGVRALHAQAERLDQAQARAVKAAGLWLVVYTENDPQAAHRLFEWGVDCVITDRPDLIC
ncbi:glycerophosphodiester phosphodiesterase [Rhodocyclaceae bacterium SMB388]